MALRASGMRPGGRILPLSVRLCRLDYTLPKPTNELNQFVFTTKCRLSLFPRFPSLSPHWCLHSPPMKDVVLVVFVFPQKRAAAPSRSSFAFLFALFPLDTLFISSENRESPTFSPLPSLSVFLQTLYNSL